MKIEIKKVDGKWTVNNKMYCDLDMHEKRFMEDFFYEVRLEQKGQEKTQNKLQTQKCINEIQQRGGLAKLNK